MNNFSSTVNNLSSMGTTRSFKGVVPKGIALETIKTQIFKLNTNISKLRKEEPINKELIKEKEEIKNMLIQQLMSRYNSSGGKRKTKRRLIKRRKTYKNKV